MKHRASASFWRGYEDLPVHVQILADKQFDLLKQDSRHPSLRFKKIREGLWSVRVGIEYRALAFESEVGLD